MAVQFKLKIKGTGADLNKGMQLRVKKEQLNDDSAPPEQTASGSTFTFPSRRRGGYPRKRYFGGIEGK